MEDGYDRAFIARNLRQASTYLLEASERAGDLKRFKLSSKLLDQAVKLDKLARELLELPAKPALQEQLPDVPF